MPDFEKFTNYSQEILNSAGAVMQQHKNSELQPAHIMLAMIKADGIVRDYLTELKLLNQNFVNKITQIVKIRELFGSGQILRRPKHYR